MAVSEIEFVFLDQVLPLRFVLVRRSLDPFSTSLRGDGTFYVTRGFVIYCCSPSSQFASICKPSMGLPWAALCEDTLRSVFADCSCGSNYYYVKLVVSLLLLEMISIPNSCS